MNPISDAFVHPEKLDSKLSSSAPVSKDANQDDYIVDFSTGDSDNPVNWPAWQKWTIVALVSSMSLLEYVELLLSSLEHSNLSQKFPPSFI